MIEYSPKNPYRVVTWRWERAGNIIAGGPGLSRKRDDAAVHKALKFRRELKAATSGIEHYLLAEKYPDIYWAYRFYANRQTDVLKISPYLIEARLLADQPYDEIADSVGTDAEVVKAYAETFFDIRSRLTSPDYIVREVFGQAVERGLKLRDYDLLWKMVAYRCGPHVLDYFVQPLVGNRPDSADGVQATVREITRVALDRNAALASVTIRPSDNMTAIQIIAEYREMLALEQSAGAAGAIKDTLMQNIDGMLAAVPFSVGSTTPDASAVGLDAYDSLDAELRGDEVIRLGAGRVIDQDEIRTLKFPVKVPAALPAPAPAGE
jgi:hypothetical protein